MNVFCNVELRCFEFWGGAKAIADAFTCEQLDELEAILPDIYPDGMSETDLNDLFWFEEDYLAELLGFSSFEVLEAYNNGEDE